jgi:hypothetical protein
MRPALLHLFVSPAALLLSAWAAQADCLSIQDNDTPTNALRASSAIPRSATASPSNRRQACVAEQRRDPDACTLVRDADARELCRQRARQQQ